MTLVFHETDGAPEEMAYRVVIDSVGSAVPAASAALAKGFGLAVDQVVACCYRAPSVLADVGRRRSRIRSR